MQLVTFGVNHKTAPVDLRERAVVAADRLPEMLHHLTREGGAREALILSTCNRTEVYCGLWGDEGRGEDGDTPTPTPTPTTTTTTTTTGTGAGGRAASGWVIGERPLACFCDYHRLSSQAIRPHLYLHEGPLAVRHAFRVACGLDSLVLGEPQILGQMKQAFAAAHRQGATGKLLNRLFQQTFSVAKQVRTDTAIGASAVSVAYAAVKLARRIFSDLREKTVLLIGAGEMVELAARHLKEQGVARMIVANRTVERAAQLGGEFGAEAIALTELPERLAEADIVISSTASPLPLLGKGAVETALKKRRHRPMFMVDIAVPRDIEPEVGDLDDVYLYTVDDLKDVIDEGMQSRLEAAQEAERIIDLETRQFMRWVRSLDAVPTIRALRDRAEALAEAELELARRRLTRGEEADLVLAQLARALTNKFTHAPSAALTEADHDGDRSLIAAARRLFRLGAPR